MNSKKKLMGLLIMNIIILYLIMGPLSVYFNLMNDYPAGEIKVEDNKVTWMNTYNGDYIVIKDLNDQSEYKIYKIGDTVELSEGEYIVEIVNVNGDYNQKTVIDNIDLTYSSD